MVHGETLFWYDNIRKDKISREPVFICGCNEDALQIDPWATEMKQAKIHGSSQEMDNCIYNYSKCL